MNFKFVFFGAFIAMHITYAQKSINTIGGEISNSNGVINYSFGQVFYSNVTNIEGSLIEGVQQPFEISVTLGVEINTINLVVKAYPNPTMGMLNLVIDDNFQSKSWSYVISDLNGKIIVNNKITNKQSQIDMSTFKSAVYFLKVTSENNEIKIFRILKN